MRSRFFLTRALQFAAALSITAVVSGCALQPATVRPQAMPNPAVAGTLPPRVDPNASPRQKMVTIALQEWQRWGSQQVRVGRDDTYCISRPSTLVSHEIIGQAAFQQPKALRSDDSVIGDAGNAETVLQTDMPCLRFPDGTGAETTATGCRLAQRYWAIVGRVPDCMEITTGRWAWSATFLSWVMRQAGLTDQQFLTGQSHAMYVTDARDGILPDSAFSVMPMPALPTAGDMVCGGRGRDKYLNDIDEIRFGATPMHCDLVVEVDRAAGIVKTIGGNVQQAVSMSVIELGDSGKLDGVTNSSVPWLLVLHNQLPS